ncbi:GldG family protein [Novosphingobium pentaromativorans]|nr:GldG family protein [Novosphingobium pentaromativorans]
MINSRTALMALLAPCLALAGCNLLGGSDAAGKSGEAQAPVPLGVYSSLPLLWGESDDIRGFLSSDKDQGWAHAFIQARAGLVPLDHLADASGALPLAKDHVLLLAQPRPLTPQENVALDDWVNAGGRVLLFADPMLTAHSIFALGDARRPQDIAMLSPILGRWGLQLEFDESQQPGERLVELEDGAVPVNLPGRFRLRQEDGSCRLEAAGFLADCRVGKGRVVALADAALFEDSRDLRDAESRGKLLDALLARVWVGIGRE